ncbi:aminopeptidase N [Ornithinimicrobium flavum]|uniref:aminopeptidase N n=1 Tax=Ornithinimicrobium flavum TaxID=1288636 RepID=UPI0013051EC7|nr:aminopeptidase N [Ornithinimicrobium flavum]
MPSLTLAQARERSRVVQEVEAYALHLDLTRDHDLTATTTVTFTAVPGESTFLDLQHALEVEVVLDGVVLDPAEVHRDDRVVLPSLRHRSTAVVTARLPYVTDGDGMHRFEDPADGEVYLGCYGGMDVNRRVFACFDQPDLKAPFTVSVTAREGWTVLSNGRPEGRPDPDGGAATWTFATTPRLSTYLVTVCAGPWASRTWEHAGLPFGWHARASLADDLDRDLPGLRAVTEGAFDWYTARFDEPYAFDSYDQVFVPGHNWGAMETPGCVTYRDELLPAGTTPRALARRRSMTIAHEMAHMWFGDLVTFRWWEDTWLNESFADLLGFRVAGEVGAAPGSLAEFDLGRKAGGYAADDRPSTHPVAPRAEDVPDVDSAFSNFDSISYAKGNSALRQLSFWLGDETFLAGVNAHLTRARFGTAELGDLVGCLQAVTDRDVTAWADRWLRTTGVDTLRVRRDGPGPALELAGERPHRLRVQGYAVRPPAGDAGAPVVDEAWEEVVDLSPEAPTLGLPEADLVLPNSNGDTFARVELDPAGLATALEVLGAVPGEHPRAVLWATVLELTSRGRLPVPDLVTALERHLPGETSEIIPDLVLARAVQAVHQVGLPTQVPPLAERIGQVALTLLRRPGVPEALVQTATGAAVSTLHDTALLRSWLADGAGHGPLSQAHRWEVILRLAELGSDVGELAAAEAAADPSAAGRLALLSAEAARPTPEAKERALARMADDRTSNREVLALARGVWSAEQRHLVDPLVERSLRDMAGVARRGQAMALVAGRSAPSFRLLPEQLAALREAAQADGLPPALARAWADLAHDQGLLPPGTSPAGRP